MTEQEFMDQAILSAIQGVLANPANPYSLNNVMEIIKEVSKKSLMIRREIRAETLFPS